MADYDWDTLDIIDDEFNFSVSMKFVKSELLYDSIDTLVNRLDDAIKEKFIDSFTIVNQKATILDKAGIEHIIPFSYYLNYSRLFESENYNIALSDAINDTINDTINNVEEQKNNSDTISVDYTFIIITDGLLTSRNTFDDLIKIDDVVTSLTIYPRNIHWSVEE